MDLRKCAALYGMAALALLAAGCGGDSNDRGALAPTATTPAVTTTEPLATAPSATQPPPDATNPSGSKGPTTSSSNGGSEPVRIDATFTLRGGRLSPRTVSTPSFLAVSLSVRNGDRTAHSILVRADRDYRLAVGPLRRAARQIPGQRAGTYPVLVDGRRRGALIFGGEPGP